MWYEFRPYVPVAQRRAQAAREVEKRRKKGQAVSPVVIGLLFAGSALALTGERFPEIPLDRMTPQQRAVLAGLELPGYELPLIGEGMDPAGLYDLVLVGATLVALAYGPFPLTVDDVVRAMENKPRRRVIVVPHRIVNVVV